MKELEFAGITFILTTQTYAEITYELEEEALLHEDGFLSNEHFQSLCDAMDKALADGDMDLYSDLHKDIFGCRPR